MFGSKKRIRIEFIDVDTGQMIGFDEKRPKHIPPTFRFETLIKIGGKTWKLIEAEPFERKKFLKAGLLTIKVQLQEDPNEQGIPPIPGEEKLYRCASRPSHFPESAGKRKGKLLEIGSWEWRCIELVSQNFRSEISREMGAIEAIRQGASTEQNGEIMYRKQHTRNLPDDVLQLKDITVSILGKSWFPFSNAFDGINFMTEDGTTSNTFAFRLPAGLTVYGHTTRNKIHSIGLLHPDAEHKLIAMQDIRRLVDFMEAQELVLVDWENNKFVEPILPVVANYFGVTEETTASAEEPALEAAPVIEEAPKAVPIIPPVETASPLEASIPADPTPAESPASESVESAPEVEEEMLFTANSEVPAPVSPPAAPVEESLELTIDHSLAADIEAPASDEEE